MKLVLKKYSGFLDIVEKILRVIEIGLLSGITLIMCYQCIMRYIFSNAQPWCEELSLYLCIYSVLLGISIAVRKESHLQVDFLLNFMKYSTRCLITALSSIVAIAFMIVFCAYSISLIQHATGASTTLPILIRHVYFAFPIGSILLILFSIENIAKNLGEFMKFKGGALKKGANNA